MEKIKTIEKTISYKDTILNDFWWKHLENDPQNQSSDSVFCSGPDRKIAQAIIRHLDQAQSMVILCSFLIADEEIVEAIQKTAQRGVHVYLLIAPENRLESDADDDFSQKCLTECKQLLKKLGGSVFIRSAPNFHAKFILHDPFSSKNGGLLTTANFTKEAIERNEELAIELSAKEVREFAELSKWILWEKAEHQMLDSTRFEPIKPLGETQIPDIFLQPEAETTAIATTPVSVALKQKCLEIIQSATKTLTVASYGWEADHEVVKTLRLKAQQGVRVLIFARRRPKAMPALMALRKAGAKILGYRWLHAKTIIADEQQAIVMSANFEPHGMDTGFEVGVVLKDAPRIQTLLSILLKDWGKRERWSLESQKTLGDLSGMIHFINAGGEAKKEDAISIIPQATKEIEMPPLTSVDEDINQAPKEFPTIPYCQEVTYRWTNKAPTLQAGSKEVYRNEKAMQKNKKLQPESFTPPIFREKTGRKVAVIEKEEELPSALILKQQNRCEAIVWRT